MPEWIKVIILGIVEGITEFLPISSTGHLLISSTLLDFQNSMKGTFEIAIQFGAVVAVVGFYWRDLWRQVRTVHLDPAVQRLWLAIVVASIPAGITGALFQLTLRDSLFSQDNAPYIVAPMLILGGFVFLIIERRHHIGDTTALYAISWKQAAAIGLAQTLALVPGVSRSGASIVGGLFAGLNRETATAFSFYLAIPVLGGATTIDLLLHLDEVDRAGLGYLLLGAVVSGIIAWAAIGWLLRYVSQHNFVPFGYYRILAGIAIGLLVALDKL